MTKPQSETVSKFCHEQTMTAVRMACSWRALVESKAAAVETVRDAEPDGSMEAASWQRTVSTAVGRSSWTTMTNSDE
jgi:hypothetical protein